MLCALETIMCAQNIWHVSPNGMGAGNGWSDACSLQHAVQNASPGDEIWAMSGYYYGNLVINVNLTIRGGFAGTENQLQDRTALSTMDINTAFSTTQFSILDATDSGRSVVRVDCDRFIMDRFTLTGGDTNFGGGLHMLGHAYLHLKDMHVCYNEVQVEGGGLYVDNVDSVRIENIVIYDNVAHSRGGGVNFVSCSRMLLLINALINNNHADFYGGGLVFENTGCLVINNTIVCNTAGVQGSAISMDCAHPALYNTIVWGNSIWPPNIGVTIYGHTQPSNISYYACCLNCENNPFLDFPNSDFRLDPNSSCVDSGIWPSVFPYSTITTDLDHNTRCNGNIDKGAYEFQLNTNK